ncbi:MAG TPA: GvpL/GvpF family gas vesicle protein [Pirellulales bacterium]|nr:GvpL/GvpF family gas vesicle protein [Pirellulales bacterium]
MAVDEGTYLYCFARPNAAGGLTSPGVDGRPGVAAICAANLAAVCSQARVEEFSPAAATDRAPDPEWLIPRVCRHQAVIEEVMARSPVLPVRFGALFSSPSAVQTVMETQATQIDRFLAYAAEKQEWAVKGFLSMKAAAAWRLEAEPGLNACRPELAVSPGKRYFQQKQLHAAAEREARQWARTVAAEILDALKDVAVESRTLKPQPAQLTGKTDEMSLNLAFLVPEQRVDEFHARVEAVGACYLERGLTLERTGPWPPFSFCPSLEEAIG